MSTEAPLDRPLDRRFLIRGGAVLAGAAGATVIGAALAPTKASAADGGNVVLGAANASESTTAITIDGTAGGPDATLTLNNANGPSLALEALPNDWDGALDVGEIANTGVGPNIGVDYGEGPVTTFLATGADLTNVYPLPAERLADTRSAAGRESVVNASSGAPFDSAGRLKGGQYIDVAVASTEEVALIGLFLNVTASRPLEGGYLETYTPGVRPVIPSITFQRLITVTNSILVAPGVLEDAYTVRIYTSKTTHVVLDLLGAITGFPPSGGAPAAQAGAPDRRSARQAKQRERLARSIKNRV